LRRQEREVAISPHICLPQIEANSRDETRLFEQEIAALRRDLNFVVIDTPSLGRALSLSFGETSVIGPRRLGLKTTAPVKKTDRGRCDDSDQRMRYSAPVTHLNPADPPAERSEHGPPNEIAAAISVIIIVIGDVIVWVTVIIIVRPA
jgi:hypothetical protein